MKKLDLHLLLILLVLIGGINWGLIGTFNVNLVSLLPDIIARIVYILVGLAAIYLFTQRDFWLPFLGKTVFPSSHLKEIVPEDSSYEIKVNVNPGDKVVYWAAEPGNDNRDPKDAYGDMSNSGVAIADENGVATLLVRKPGGYEVGAFKKKLKPHVHYRTVLNDWMLSSVKTVY